MFNEQIKELYDIGLEKFAGDESAAKDFVKGFLKEASAMDLIGKGALDALGKGGVALGLGLGIHGISSAINAAGTANLRTKFEHSLAQVTASNPLLTDVDPAKLKSYADTVFKFAPHIAGDPNILSSVLAHVVQGEGVDVTIVRTLTDLEAKLVESRKGALFSPKSYL